MTQMPVPAIVGHVGRHGLRFALTDGAGQVVTDTMRFYEPERMSSVAGALMAFQDDMGVRRFPVRSGIAVAGLVQGDTISVTHTRTFLSRSGLEAMLGCAPLILNDFAASAWAFSTADRHLYQPLTKRTGNDPIAPGTYCIVGMTSGFGAAVLVRQADCGITIIPTEAGHAGFAPASQGMATLVAAMFPNTHPVGAEQIVSARGLVSIFDHLNKTGRSTLRPVTPEAITRARTTDPTARMACDILCEAFWTYVGNLVLSYGCWDGVIVTGSLAKALQTDLEQEKSQQIFAVAGKHARRLESVPRYFALLDNSEVIGVAAALHRDDASFRSKSPADT